MAKKVFKVYASRTQTFTTEVLAEDYNEAIKLGEETKAEDYELVSEGQSSDDWCVFNAFDTEEDRDEDED